MLGTIYRNKEVTVYSAFWFDSFCLIKSINTFNLKTLSTEYYTYLITNIFEE